MVDQQLFTACLTLAALLALVTLGFNLVYGVLKFLNLAHPEIVVLGALLIYKLSGYFGFPIAAIMGILVTGASGIALGRVFFRPLRFLPRSAMLATSLGLALIFQVVYIVATKQASISLRPDPIVVASVVIDWQSTWLLVIVALLSVLGLEFWLQRTRLGCAVCAIAENPTLAEGWGLPVSLAYDVVFGLSFSLAALSGLFIALHYSTSFGFAFKILVWSFSTILVGGLGKPLGGALASVPIALIWTVLGRMGLEPYVDPLLLLCCACIYLVLPEGILGRRLRAV